MRFRVERGPCARQPSADDTPPTVVVGAWEINRFRGTGESSASAQRSSRGDLHGLICSRSAHAPLY